MKFGLEVEVYLLEKVNNHFYLNDSTSILNYVLDNTDERVYRDYYRYQLELRSKPCKHISDCFQEIVDLYNKVRKLLEDTNYFIVPLSYIPSSIVDEIPMFNGMHIHISDTDLDELIDRVYALYPYMLIINRLFHSSPKSTISSMRLLESQHIYKITPNYYKSDITNEDRYVDITLNYHDENSRHRLKDCTTIEIRLFDTPPFVIEEIEFYERVFRDLEKNLTRIDIDTADLIINKLISLEKINLIDHIRTLSAYKIPIDSLKPTIMHIYSHLDIAYSVELERALTYTLPMIIPKFYSKVIKSSMI